MHPEVILWDWDNTLVDAWGGVQAALNATFAEFGLPPWTRDDVLARVRGSMQESFPPLFGAGWREAAARFRAHHAARQLAQLMPMPGADATLAAFAGRQGVVSNKEAAPLRREIAHLGWSARFEVIVGADDAPAAKPSPDTILHALRSMGVKPGPAVWYAGDTGVDMLAARAAGVTSVLVGDAAHDGGVAALSERGAAPHLHFLTMEALARRLGSE